MWDMLRLDVRHAFRGLRRAPTYSCLVVLTLTVAIGATTAVASLLYALVLRPLAVPHPEQLVTVSALDPQTNTSGWLHADTIETFRGAQRAFAQMAMYAGGGLAQVETRSGIVEAVTDTVSPAYFEMVGARLAAGRFFNDTDDAVVIISETFRRRVFGNGPGLGETITVDAVPATVIGVTIDGFDGLRSVGFDVIKPFGLTRPAPDDVTRGRRARNVVGRLRPGVSIDAARAELLARWPSMQQATVPATLPDAERAALLRQRLDVAPVDGAYWERSSRYATTLLVLLGLMAMLLAVACANLSGLTLARSLTRRHQVAVRLALGASARRVFWQLLLDGLLLAAVAFAGAVAVAWTITRAVSDALMSGLFVTRFPDVTPDARVLAAAALVTLLLGLAMGVVAAWQSVITPVDACLRRGRGSAGSLGRFGRGLLVAQIALSMVCLVGAGLFTATLTRLRANDTSLQSQRIIFSRAYRSPGDREVLRPEYYRALVDGLTHMPGAEAAALSVYYPTYYHTPAQPPMQHYTRSDLAGAREVAAMPECVSPGFFDLFRVPRLQGRDISWTDGPGSPDVALISASLARVLFPDGDAVGRHLRPTGPERREIEVIGVVGDAPYGKLDDPRPYVVFRPILQELERSQFPMAYVRSRSDDLAPVREGYARVIKDLGHRSLRGFMTSSAYVDSALLRQRFTAGLASVVAAITVLLACLGVYGLLAYSVTARVREIGVRLALGAAPGHVVWMVVRNGLAIAVPGVLVGATCAWAAARIVQAQLYGVAPGDPRTLLLAALVSLATAVAAAWLPALRASKVTPVDALRDE